MPFVRAARPADAEAAAEVLRDSITKLGVADHRNDPDTLQQWLEGKSASDFHDWIADEDKFCVVAQSRDKIRGVGLIDRRGEIRLCYISPRVRGQGVGGKILAALEQKAAAWGLSSVHLQSTASARPFYEIHGYIAAGESTCGFGLAHCHPYRKELRQAAT